MSAQRQSTLLTRMYRSMEDAREHWAQDALRARARRAAEQYCRYRALRTSLFLPSREESA